MMLKKLLQARGYILEVHTNLSLYGLYGHAAKFSQSHD